MTLLSIAALIWFPVQNGAGGTVKLVAEARILTARLRAARGIALASRQQSAVSIDAARRRIEGPGSNDSYGLSAVEAIHVHSARQQTAEQVATIVFFPDGGSTGGEVMLSSGTASRVIRVDWLTGTVSSGEPGP